MNKIDFSENEVDFCRAGGGFRASNETVISLTYRPDGNRNIIVCRHIIKHKTDLSDKFNVFLKALTEADSDCAIA